LAEMLCGFNIFEEPDDGPATRRNILGMPLPDFRELRPAVSEDVAEILRRSLARDRRRRYQSASEMLSELERYLYSHTYGPTTEKLAIYLRALFLGGKAYEDDLQTSSATTGLAPSQRPADTSH